MTQVSFTQVRELLPARANSTLGVLVEPNILEHVKSSDR